jgi:cysteinyl-tRNA synthetase
MTVRFFILSSHYRSNTDFSDGALQGAAKGYERLVGAVGLLRQRLVDAPEGEPVDEAVLAEAELHEKRVLEAMDDDLNTPQALAVLFDLNKGVNTLLNSGQPVSKGTLAAIDRIYRTLGGDILGLIPDELPQESGAGLDAALMAILIDLRASARQNKDWATADVIRDRLEEAGVSLEDRPEGTSWRLMH